MSQFTKQRLGDLVDILSGFAFDSKNFSDSGKLPIVRIRDVIPGSSSTFYSGEYDQKFVIRDGDLLIGMDGEFNRARWQGGNALLNQRVCRITASSPNLDDAYLFHFLPLALKAIEDVTPYVTVKHLSVKTIRDIEISLPSLEEQRRIAEILDRAEELRSKRRQAIAQLDTLTKAIFLEVFGDPVLNGWAMETIAEIVHPSNGSIRTGPFGSQLLHSEFVEEGIAVLGIDNVVANEFRWGERRFISELKYRGLKRYTVSPGDVIITTMGTCGRCAVVPDSIPVAINTKHLCCITLNQEKCLPRFLHAYFLLHPIARQYLNQTQKGAIMPGLNMGIIKSMPIFIPPLSLQKEFARHVEVVEKLKTAHRTSLSELDALFASLQHRAFRGEL